MRLPLATHEAHPWLVNQLATDFTLDEVWEFPIVGDARKGETFRTFCQLQDAARSEPLSGPAEWLIKLRLLLGRLGPDRRINQRPIPGCTETSVWERMKPGDRQPMSPPDGRLSFRMVYDRDTERLLELSNGTVHALVHFGWAEKTTDGLFAPRMAVYVKPRGWLGRLYMAIIYPFRVLIVYPAIMRAAKRRWEGRRST